MKEAFNDLQIIFPEMPEACENALLRAARSVPVRERRAAFRSSFAIVLALMLALTCAAGAAFHPQIVDWFARHYGDSWGAWMQEGSVAAPHRAMEAEGAIISIDEVLTRGRGLYVLGTIRPQEGYTISDYDSRSTPEAGSTLRYVSVYLDLIGVDGGAMLTPATWGYAVEANADGSLTFSIEAEDGMAIEPGSEYTLALSARTYGANADGSVNPDDYAETALTFTVTPERFKEEMQ